eukprot:11530753-Heterocapsa_arctica.AAC.1
MQKCSCCLRVSLRASVHRIVSMFWPLIVLHVSFIFHCALAACDVSCHESHTYKTSHPPLRCGLSQNGKGTNILCVCTSAYRTLPSPCRLPGNAHTFPPPAL